MDNKDHVYFDAHQIRNIPYIGELTMSETIQTLGFNTIVYHPDANSWLGAWSMEEKEYTILVLKYG